MVRGETVQSDRNSPTFLRNVSTFLPDYKMSQIKAVVFLFAAVTISNLALLLQIENKFLRTKDLFPLCVFPSQSKRTFLIYKAHPKTNHADLRGSRGTALLLVIPGFRREVDENCALQGLLRSQ
jgi:hypothetical protein